MKQKINEFIRNIKLLKSVEDNLIFLQHHAQINHHDKTFLNLEKINQAIKSANKDLPKKINQCLKINNSKDSYKSIEENINFAIASVLDVNLENSAMKEELLEILKSCSKAFSNEGFTDIFDIIKNNSDELHQQIITLEDLCSAEY